MVEALRRFFKLEDNIEVVIVSIDEDKRRINVSIKRLSKTPSFASAY